MSAVVPVPDKLFFRIGEVADLTGVPPYVLRYWESEFKLLRPRKNHAGQRVYRKQDIELVLRIKRLLYEEGFTIAGARKHLADIAAGHGSGEAGHSARESHAEAPAAPVRREPASRAQRKFLLDLHEELLAVLTLLERE